MNDLNRITLDDLMKPDKPLDQREIVLTTNGYALLPHVPETVDPREPFGSAHADNPELATVADLEPLLASVAAGATTANAEPTRPRRSRRVHRSRAELIGCIWHELHAVTSRMSARELVNWLEELKRLRAEVENTDAKP